VTRTRIEIRQCKYLNNIVESDHRFVKRNMKQAMGFETFESAMAILTGIEMWHMIKKVQAKWGGRKSPIDVFYSLAI